MGCCHIMSCQAGGRDERKHQGWVSFLYNAMGVILIVIAIGGDSDFNPIGLDR
jgi:hypothetical protein